MPRKLGQHFLVRETILERLAEAACGEHTPRVIEIGPGRGALTSRLLPRTDELHAVELDGRLVEHLKRKFAHDSRVHIHKADVLDTDLSQWGPAVLASNLPYYITSPIIERFLELDERFPRATLLMQWEVAERLVARPRTRAYGYLTVATQLVCEVELLCKVPPAAFSPPPKVDSGAVQLARRPQRPSDLAQLLAFVGRCFAHKRKTLRNNLRPFYGPAIEAQPEASLRAEQLSPPEFADLLSRLAPPATPAIQQIAFVH